MQSVLSHLPDLRGYTESGSKDTERERWREREIYTNSVLVVVVFDLQDGRFHGGKDLRHLQQP